MAHLRRLDESEDWTTTSRDELHGRRRARVAEGPVVRDDPLPNTADLHAIHELAGMKLAEDYIRICLDAISRPLRPKSGTLWEDYEHDSRNPGARSPEWPPNTGRDFVKNNLPPQSLWASESSRLKAMRRRHTWKKLAIQELSTAIFILKVIPLVNYPRFRKNKKAREDLSRLSPALLEIAGWNEEQQMAAQRILQSCLEKLHTVPVDSSAEIIREAHVMPQLRCVPSYHQDSDGDYHAICEQMNEGIKAIFQKIEKRDDRDMAVAMAKICHNLLISTASPDIKTFNILLEGFESLSKTDCTDNVIKALEVQKIRPNENTCRRILKFYIRENRPDRFSSYVAKMRGMDDALMLANPDININGASEGRLQRTKQNKVLQLVHPSPLIFEAIIYGVLRFAGFDRALDVYYEMKHDGWGLTTEGLIKLLEDCIKRADWVGGLYVWTELDIVKPKTPRHLMSVAYSRMLSLTTVCKKSTAFNVVLREVATGGFNTQKIIDKAERVTKRVPGQPIYFPPAWTMENVMTAVDAYIQYAKQNKIPMEPRDEDDDEIENLFPRESDPAAEEIEPDPQAEQAWWAKWFEHEHGNEPQQTKSPES